MTHDDYYLMDKFRLYVVSLTWVDHTAGESLSGKIRPCSNSVLVAHVFVPSPHYS